MKLEVVINYDERTAIVWIVKADKSYDLVTYTAKRQFTTQSTPRPMLRT